MIKGTQSVTDAAAKPSEKANTGTRPNNSEERIFKASNANITFTQAEHVYMITC